MAIDDKKTKQVIDNTLQNIVMSRGLNVVVGIIILVIAHFLGVLAKAAIKNAGDRKVSVYVQDKQQAAEDEVNRHTLYTHVSNVSLMYVTIASLSYWVIMILAIVLVLRVLGVEAASIITIIGAAGFAVGLAVQGTLTDISSGIVLAILQYYTVGDIIEIDGKSGYVREFNLINTVVEDVLTRAYVNIPNRKVQEAILYNHTRLPKRMVVFDILLSNKNKDFVGIINLIGDVVMRFPNILPDPKPIIGVSDMSEVGTSLRVRAWIERSHYPLIIVQLQSAVRQALANAGVEMTDPF
jgi:small conductance mechanosensitive channel